MSGPSVAAVIPVWNCEAYLAEAIESALAQTRPPAEVIVVNDGSTDGSRAVAESFGPPVQVISQEQMGVGAVRMPGVAAATSDLVAFLDADDLWQPSKLELQLAALFSVRAAAFALGEIEDFLSPDAGPAVARRVLVRGRRPAYCASVLLAPRALLREVPFRAQGAGEFLDWILRAHHVGYREVMVPELLARRRIYGGNYSLVNRRQRSNYARLLKESLDRRRAAAP